jgi:hypothetical protein
VAVATISAEETAFPTQGENRFGGPPATAATSTKVAGLAIPTCPTPAAESDGTFPLLSVPWYFVTVAINLRSSFKFGVCPPR